MKHLFFIRRGSDQKGNIAFSSDGKRIAAGTTIWDAGSGALLRQVDFPGEDLVNFTPDSRYLLVMGKTLRLMLADESETLTDACSHFLSELTSSDRSQYGFTGNQPTCEHFAPGFTASHNN
jgi:hypothetical protein